MQCQVKGCRHEGALSGVQEEPGCIWCSAQQKPASSQNGSYSHGQCIPCSLIECQGCGRESAPLCMQEELGPSVKCAKESDIFRALGLAYVPFCMRWWYKYE